MSPTHVNRPGPMLRVASSASGLEREAHVVVGHHAREAPCPAGEMGEQCEVWRDLRRIQSVIGN